MPLPDGEVPAFLFTCRTRGCNNPTSPTRLTPMCDECAATWNLSYLNKRKNKKPTGRSSRKSKAPKKDPG